jgi:transposase
LKGKLGQLVPCLEDAEGRIFDGIHRKAIDPKAWTVKLDKIKTPVDRAQARMTVNFCRRHYMSEEMREDIALQIGSGLTVEQIADATGISKSTIYNYMPQELKDQKRVEAGKLGGEARAETFATSLEQTVKTQDTAQPEIPQRIQRETLNELVECANCHMGFHISKATLIDNKNVCPRCAEHVKPQPKPKIEPTPFKPKETGDFRVAQMHPQKSKFELQVIQELQAEGLPLETDREFCVQKTVPDAILKLKDRTIAIYIDNVETHKEGNERDEWLRGLLEKLYNVKVCPIRYRADTKEEVQRAKETVREFLKW